MNVGMVVGRTVEKSRNRFTKKIKNKLQSEFWDEDVLLVSFFRQILSVFHRKAI